MAAFFVVASSVSEPLACGGGNMHADGHFMRMLSKLPWLLTMQYNWVFLQVPSRMDLNYP